MKTTTITLGEPWIRGSEIYPAGSTVTVDQHELASLRRIDFQHEVVDADTRKGDPAEKRTAPVLTKSAE